VTFPAVVLVLRRRFTGSLRMRKLLLAALALVACTSPTTQAITVSAPSNWAQLASPFTVTASTTTCAGVPAVSMGYSIDSGTAVIEPTSFSAKVSAAPGAHVLHVKCWGKNTHDEVLLNIAVATAPVSDITVATPSNGATLSSPFMLTASTKTCASRPAVSMGYSIDSATAVIEPTSFTASVSAPLGAHVLHVKCWGQGVGDQVLLNVNVVQPTASAPSFSLPAGSYTSSQLVSISSPTAGAKIYYTVDGSAPTSASLLYTGPIAVSKTMVLSAISAAAGYASSGVAQASYTISIPKGPQIPSYANVQQQIDLLPGWRIKHDPATPGTATGSMTLVSDPTLTGQTEKYYTAYTNSGGILYSNTYGNDTDSTNFVYDINVWLTADSVLSNLEMDGNQVTRNGHTIIYGFQCSGYSNVWEYTENSGTVDQTKAHWLKSTAPCNPAKWTRNTWHHIQISVSRDDSGNVTYHSVWFDGQEQPINQTVMSEFSLGWALGALVANFQVDGLGTSGSATIYVDNLKMSRW
jgi:hypothetical protein